MDQDWAVPVALQWAEKEMEEGPEVEVQSGWKPN